MSSKKDELQAQVNMTQCFGQSSNLELPIYLFHQGTNYESYEFMGAHPGCSEEKEGYFFRVWAPHAKAVSVVGDFNDWMPGKNVMQKISAGIYETFVPDLHVYDTYKYAIETEDGSLLYKADPYAFHCETAPANASKIYDLRGYSWQDGAYCQHKRSSFSDPINIYEVHLGSWKRREDGACYDYVSMAKELVQYVKYMGYTHVEVMPIQEYPFDGSWGYQVTGYFAPTSRYGTPIDFMEFVDILHQAGIGVILDWVPAHFPKDAFGLYEFDGQPCYEYADPKKGEHRDWGTRVFDFGRNEVQSFLVSSAIFWIKQYHIDGLRVDAVASMLYLDYGRDQGEWIPNIKGGRENLEAIALLRKLNEAAYGQDDTILMIAEESTNFPLVTRPTYEGGLGFTYKWNMGWMNDTLSFMQSDPYVRPAVHNKMTFSFQYAYSENFILPLSHDEVVHGKHSLIDKMPGEYEAKFDNLRCYLGYMMAHPGKKLLFMGGEFAQFIEWRFYESLEFFLLDYPKHRVFHEFVRELNLFYLEQSALWELDTDPQGFEWISGDNHQQNILAFVRRDKKQHELIVIANFLPAMREHYQIGVPKAGSYRQIFSTDDIQFDGKGIQNGSVKTQEAAMHGREQSITLTLPALSVMFFTLEKETEQQESIEYNGRGRSYDQ